MEEFKRFSILIIAIFFFSCASTQGLYLTHTGFHGLKKGATKEEFQKWWIEPNKVYKGSIPVWETAYKEGDNLWEILVFDVYDAPSVLHGKPIINHQEHVAFRNGLLEKWGVGVKPDSFSTEKEVTIEIITHDDLEKAVGTAWPSEYGYVVTCFHVVDRKSKITLIRTDGQKISASVYATDIENDLALLLPEDFTLVPPPLVLSEIEPRMGAEIFTIGFPLPHITGFSPKLFTGKINSLTGLKNDPKTMQISAPVQQGNSGGPLFNMRGEVIGITSATLKTIKHFNWYGDAPQGINYATKVGNLTKLLRNVHGNKDKIKFKSILTDNKTIEEITEILKNSVLLVTAE